jgi:hypothetical protein
MSAHLTNDVTERPACPEVPARLDGVRTPGKRLVRRSSQSAIEIDGQSGHGAMVRSFPPILVLFHDQSRPHLPAIATWEALLLVPRWPPCSHPPTAVITNGGGFSDQSKVSWLRV